MKSTYRMNRAVGVMSKGDEFTADPEAPVLQALLGAGYADLVYEPSKQADEDDAEIRGEPGNDPN